MRRSRPDRFRPLAAALGVAALVAGALVAATAGGASAATTQKVQVVHVLADTQAERSAVARLGVDLTEHADASGIGVVLHSARDAATLRSAGYSWRVEDPDLQATLRSVAKQDAAYAKKVAKSPLPSGRNAYRGYQTYLDELTALAQRYPDTVKPLTLKNTTKQGRVVRGIEITRHASAVNDGKPVFLLMGLHHAREWPSGENAMEYAYDLLQNDGKDPRATRIVEGTRTIIVPVVNPDGFAISRNAIRSGGDLAYEYKRKNCTISVSTPAQYLGGTCGDNPAGPNRGVDLNRNYPGFWGGGGASADWSDETFRGDSPASEVEVDNIRRLVSERQVTTLISNHTFSNLVLRPPSIADTGFSPDEPAYKALGAAMAGANGYTNQASYQLYDTSGSTEDWSYWNTGGLGFTFEIGTEGFHPPFQTGVVAEYLGVAPAAGAGKGGNREAYYRASEATIDSALHSTITGRAPAGHQLRISKQFVTQTSPVIRPDGTVGPPLYYSDRLRSFLDTQGGKFSWAVNPSTRPLVVGRWGRDPLAPPQPTQAVTNPPGIPAEGESESFTFTIEGLPTYDNAKAQVRVQWPDSSVDWDVYVTDAAGNDVGSAASLDDPEVATLVDPVPGTYTVTVENYEGGATSDWTAEVRFLSPDPEVVTGVTETWSLACLDARGTVVARQQVLVKRGQSVDVGRPCVRAAK